MAMTVEQGAVFAVLGAAMFLFIWSRWRYDLIAVSALLAAVALGVVPVERAFAGFGHPAVITVAAVLAISHALQLSGVVDSLSRLLALTRRSPTRQVGAFTTLVAGFSALMNNVGALALMMPVALRNARRAGRSPSVILMPLSFGSLLGGLITLIGTPPNIVIATFRANSAGAPFAMFDFTPVGLSVAVAGILFITVAGWRLIPGDSAVAASARDRFHIEAYVTEGKVPEDSPLDEAQIRDLEQRCENEITVMAIVRNNHRILAPAGTDRVRTGDILILEGDLEAMQPLFADRGLVQVSEGITPDMLHSDQVRLVEAVVMPNAPIQGRSMRRLRMHENYGINLLAVSRQGQAPQTQLRNVRFDAGDVLLLQGDRAVVQRVLSSLGCLPLAERPMLLSHRPRSLLPVSVFAVAIAATAVGIVPVQIAFVAAVAVLVFANALPLRELYSSIEWPVIILLGALIPIGEALQHTGATMLIGEGISAVAAEVPTWAILTLVMVASMILSDLIHNTPTAVVMAPIGLSIAQGLGLPGDPFLMAVAVGSASPYLTPIGHQCNTLVMGPGGYRFGDYWRMGLPLDAVIISVAVPMILWVWM